MELGEQATFRVSSDIQLGPFVQIGYGASMLATPSAQREDTITSTARNVLVLLGQQREIQGALARIEARLLTTASQTDLRALYEKVSEDLLERHQEFAILLGNMAYRIDAILGILSRPTRWQRLKSWVRRLLHADSN